MNRRYGRAPKGQAAIVREPLRRSARWSILPAYTIDGYLPGALITQSSVNGDMFSEWLEFTLLRMCNAYPSPRSVLVMDNCSTHRNANVRRLCAERGVLLVYLPPYSPDYNPIEKSFHLVKNWMRRHDQLAPRQATGYEDQFVAFVRHALDGWQGRVDHEKLFRSCHVTI